MSGLYEKCLECGARVRNTFKDKLRHLVRDHPLQCCRVLAPLVSADPFTAGAQLGDYAKTRLINPEKKQ